jgi:hypothetical protein
MLYYCYRVLKGIRYEKRNPEGYVGVQCSRADFVGEI